MAPWSNGQVGPGAVPSPFWRMAARGFRRFRWLRSRRAPPSPTRCRSGRRRGAGRLRRWRAPAAERVPGQVPRAVDPTALERLAARLARAARSSRRPTARRRPPRWWPRSCGPACGSRTTTRRQPRFRGRVDPARGERGPAGALRGGRGGAARGRATDAAAGDAASATSSATSSTATASWSTSPTRWRAMALELDQDAAARPQRGRPAGRRPRATTAPGRVVLRPRRPAPRRPGLQHAADSK